MIIGQLLEILELGSFEVLGGESPMVFIRVNNPKRVRYDGFDKNYQNLLLEKTLEKHKVSAEIMNYFFTRGFTNDERWSFIEDFFLGENNEELMRKYPGRELERLDIIEQLNNKTVQHLEPGEQEEEEEEEDGNANRTIIPYPPHAGKYYPNDHLTLEVNSEHITRTIRDWMTCDPASLHKAIIDHIISVDSDSVYNPLISNIERTAPVYYTRYQGLRKVVSIPGWKDPIMAECAMKEDPVKFYKWWATNRDQVYIPLQDKIRLLEKVQQLKPSALQDKDKKMLNR